MNTLTVRPRARQGFTLVELLVSITVLAIMLAALGTATNLVIKTWLNGINMVDNFTKARTMLGLFDRDIQQMIMRRDLAAFADADNAPACAFYTGQGANQKRSLALVQYSLQQSGTSSVLRRLSHGMNFKTDTPAVGFNEQLVQLNDIATEPENIASGIIAFRWQFIDGKGSVLTPPYADGDTPFRFDYQTPDAAANPRIVVISLAVISDRAYQQTVQNGTLAAVVEQFSGTAAPPGNQTYAQHWNNDLLSLNNSEFWQKLPAPLRANGSVQVFERYIPLPVIIPAPSP